MIRIAAVGDLHLGEEGRGDMRPLLADLPDRADVLLLAGDLTKCGHEREVAVVADEVRDVGVPVIAVLGNHDYHAGREELATKILQEAGVTVLEGDAVVLDIKGQRLGVAGSKGFGGGFAGACGTEFGEREMKAFVGHTRSLADDLETALGSIETDHRVALLHYSPIRDTLAGEPLEIYPFLGSYLLAEAIDRVGASLVLHGHAHSGTEKGFTAAGIPVRNVSRPVIRHAYAIYHLNGATIEHDRAATFPGARRG